MGEPIPPESMLAIKPVREPDAGLPLEFRLTRAEATEVRRRLGCLAHDAVRPLIDELERLAHPQQWPIRWVMPYREYLALLGVLGQQPYLRVAPIVHELGRQAEPQLHAGAHIEAQTDGSRVN